MSSGIALNHQALLVLVSTLSEYVLLGVVASSVAFWSACFDVRLAGLDALSNRL